MFEPTFYRKQIGQESLSDQKALQHYLTTGWKKNLDPSPNFSTVGYLQAYPDVRLANKNPLVHYIDYGIKEGRSTQQTSQYSIFIERVDLSFVKGWAVNNKNPGQIFDVRILIDGLLYCSEKNNLRRDDLKRTAISDGAGGVHAFIPLKYLEVGKHTIAFQLPNNNLVSKTVNIPKRSEMANREPHEFVSDVTIKIVVPIYNAVEDLAICIELLKAHTPQNIEVILIDDCSPDTAIQEMLNSVRDDPQFRVLSNSKNLGFTQTVNRGLKEANDADVIILNSDARVTLGWTKGLLAAAYSRPKVATVTPMSDNAGVFSAPNLGRKNILPPGISEADFARAFRRHSLRLYPEVPTGNGFCMYMRRAGIDALGPLDYTAFPRGYGEENDYCMRALRAGWFNLIDDATYVFHERTKSFREAEKTENIVKGRKEIDRRYPEYEKLIQCYASSSLIRLARYRARLALAGCSNGKGVLPRAIFVIATQTGGYSADKC